MKANLYKIKILLFIFILMGLDQPVKANTTRYLELPLFFSSNMVLQRDVPLKFWGWATPKETVVIEFLRQNKLYQTSATVDSEGKWTASLSAHPASSEPCELRFSLKGSSGTLQVLKNVLVGDVWFASGQSNMEKKVNHLLEATKYIQEANSYPLIRSFKTTYYAVKEPQERVNNTSLPWFECNSQLVGDNVSAVAYVFARYIQEELQIPIGIIQSYRGGTEIETWISPWKFAEPQYCKVAGRKDFLEDLNRTNSHSVNYNGQINPLKGLPIKGFIWYQGESNTKRAKEYRYMMKMLIEDWRSLWNLGDLPFYYVQMYNYSDPALYNEYNWADLREQQEFLLYDKTVANTGMAVIIDTNEEATNPDANVRGHPRNKKPVGERLARIALKETYGKDILSEGPRINQFLFKNDSVYLYFSNYGNGLKAESNEAPLQGFVMSGLDNIFRPAKADIINDSTVVVTNSLISNPVAVRYAWARNPICNLYNSDDLPTMPFRTDSWISKVTYSQYKTSCNNPDSDASLVSIRLNGVQIEGFIPTQYNYNYTINSNESYPIVSAVPNSPWAKFEVANDQVTQNVTITVTAENGNKHVYKISINTLSSTSENLDNSSLNIFQSSSKLIIQNNQNEIVDVKIFNEQGHCVLDEKLTQLEQRKISVTPGVYLIRSYFGKFNRKFLFL